MAYKIGYIDEDEGWKSTFYHAFSDDFEVVVFDLSEYITAEALLDQIFSASLDMLVIDFLLVESGVLDFNADRIVELIQERNLYYPLIILTSNETDALDHIENVNLINGKDMLGSEGDNSKTEILKHKFTKIIESYKQKLEGSEAELSALETKRNENGLDPDEEDKYVELNSYLDNVSTSKGRISRTFYSEDTNKRLDDLIKKTQSIIELIEKDQNKA